MEKHNNKRCSVIAVLSVVTLVGIGLGLSLFIHYQQRNKHPRLQNQPSTYPTVAITSTTAPTQATETIHEHSYTTETKEATCVKEGYTRYTCACGKSYDTDKTPLRSHLYGDWKTVKKPTATSTGKKEVLASDAERLFLIRFLSCQLRM